MSAISLDTSQLLSALLKVLRERCRPTPPTVFGCVPAEDDPRIALLYNLPQRRQHCTPPTWLDAPLCRALLRDEGPDLAALQPVPPTEVLAAVRSKQGWPSSPYVKTLAWGLAHWTATGQMPVLGQAQPLLGDLEGAAPLPVLSHAGRLEEARRRLNSALAKGGVDVEPAVCDALHVGGSPRFILNLLGLRSTTGSLQDLLPPSLRACWTSFHKRHCPQGSVSLTVGARALAKHCHRDDSASFWGRPSGSPEAYNAASTAVLCRLICDAVWLNVHLLPHDLKVFEVRTAEGYGARWLADGSEFRGFLEPQMEEGHSKGWRHS